MDTNYFNLIFLRLLLEERLLLRKFWYDKKRLPIITTVDSNCCLQRTVSGWSFCSGSFLSEEGCIGTYAYQETLRIPAPLRKKVLLDGILCCSFCCQAGPTLLFCSLLQCGRTLVADICKINLSYSLTSQAILAISLIQSLLEAQLLLEGQFVLPVVTELCGYN